MSSGSVRGALNGALVGLLFLGCAGSSDGAGNTPGTGGTSGNGAGSSGLAGNAAGGDGAGGSNSGGSTSGSSGAAQGGNGGGGASAGGSSGQNAAGSAGDSTGTGGNPAGGAGGDSNAGAGGAQADVWYQCGQTSDCVLVPMTCCGSCGAVTPEDAAAVNTDHAQDYRNEVCGAAAICPSCIMPDDPRVSALCDNGACTVELALD